MATPATAADWSTFASSLEGRLVQPGGATYERDHELFDTRFDSVRPEGIAFCASESDVQRTIAFARAHALPFAVRCGGHSYGGYSTTTGLVCDVGPLGGVTPDAARGQVTLGAGGRLIDVYDGVGRAGLAVPGGTCASVGISGLALGGGQGVLGRKLGLTADAVMGLRIVTADGVVRACDASNEADLFWACRGGGGGQWGVVTEWTLRASIIGSLVRFSATWDWDAASDVMAAWQEWAPVAPDELWAKINFSAVGTSRRLVVVGVRIGSEADLRGDLDRLFARTGRPRSQNATTAPFLDTMFVEASCSDRSLAECHLPSVHPEGTLHRRSHFGGSAFFDRPLTPAGVRILTAALEERGTSPLLEDGSGMVMVDALGGAIGRVAPDATAFVHRNALFLAQYSAHAGGRATPEELAANTDWLARLKAAMLPHSSGGAYVSYTDENLVDYETAYYGTNLPRLRSIKAAVDPDGVFSFAQSLRP